MSRDRRFDLVPIVPSLIVAVLSFVAALGFRGVFPDFTFLASAVIGALGATAIGVVIWLALGISFLLYRVTPKRCENARHTVPRPGTRLGAFAGALAAYVAFQEPLVLIRHRHGL